MNMRALPVFLAALLLATVPLFAQSRQAAPGTAPRPAGAAFSCDRNNLTVYTGVVRYRRLAGRTTLRIRTDAETTENVTLRHTGTDDSSVLFTMQGEPFKTSDWSTIETSKGVLRPGVRASAWVCADGQVMIVGVVREVRTSRRSDGPRFSPVLSARRASDGRPVWLPRT